MQLILLCGAGGTGKSTVTDLMAKRKDCNVMRSSSRDTYKRLGIATETAAFGLSVDQQKHLQDEILKDHLNKLQDCAQETLRMGADYLVIDRSPFDHLAYWTRTNALDENSSNLDFLQNLDLVNTIIEGQSPEVVGFFDFPYPTPWNTSDGMRDQNRVKTFEMSLLTTGLLHRYYRTVKAQSVFLDQVGLYSPEMRVNYIIDQMRVTRARLHGAYS